MPTYSYECKSCEDSFEVKQGMSDDKLKVCSKCGQEALQRVLGTPGFSLKGTGWYATDFKGDR
jgi:putative FmdB family regulatory protein